jgi:hypothetical protein
MSMTRKYFHRSYTKHKLITYNIYTKNNKQGEKYRTGKNHLIKWKDSSRARNKQWSMKSQKTINKLPIVSAYISIITLKVTFCPGWPQTAILLKTISVVARFQVCAIMSCFKLFNDYSDELNTSNKKNIKSIIKTKPLYNIVTNNKSQSKS